MSFYRKHQRVQFKSDLPSRTKQSFLAECDINRIMKKYQKGEIVTHVNKFPGGYGDFIAPPDYHEAMNKVIAAQAMFGSLPSSVRSRFANDPGLFLAFVGDPKNTAELISMGLAKARPMEASHVTQETGVRSEVVDQGSSEGVQAGAAATESVEAKPQRRQGK